LPSNPQILSSDYGIVLPDDSRAYDMRRDNDVVKVPAITLYDIDYAIFYHLNNLQRFKVEQEGISIDVPVMFAGGEKWVQYREFGYLRDNKNKIMAPLITIKRTNITDDERIPSTTINYIKPVLRYYGYKSLNMQYDRTRGQYATHESNEYYLIDFPNYIRVGYELLIWTESMEQMNGILEALIADNNHMWGDSFKFRTVITDTTTDTVNAPGLDRMVKATVTLQVDGYVRAEYERRESNITKAFSIKRIDFLSESTESEFYLNQPTDIKSNSHISQQPYEEMQKAGKRDIRYRN